MKPQTKSLFQLHIAVLLFGGTALFSHLLPWSAVDITILRTAIASVALAIIIKLQGDKLTLNNFNDYRMAIILGITVGLHWVTYFYAMQLAGVAVGMLAFFCFPIVTVFLEPLFTKSKPHLRDISCALLVFLGIVLLVPELTLENNTTLGVIIGSFSGVCYAVRNVMHKHYFSHYKGTQAMFYQTGVVAIMLSPFLTQSPFEMNGVWVNGQLGELGLLLILSIVFTALPHSFIANCFKHLSAKTAGLISCMQPVYGIILAVLLLNQWPDYTVYIGGSCIVFAAIFETILVTKK